MHAENQFAPALPPPRTPDPSCVSASEAVVQRDRFQLPTYSLHCVPPGRSSAPRCRICLGHADFAALTQTAANVPQPTDAGGPGPNRRQRKLFTGFARNRASREITRTGIRIDETISSRNCGPLVQVDAQRAHVALARSVRVPGVRAALSGVLGSASTDHGAPDGIDRRIGARSTLAAAAQSRI